MTKRSVSEPITKVVSKAHQPVEAVLQQINTMDQLELSEVLRAIARRISPLGHSRSPDRRSL